MKHGNGRVLSIPRPILNYLGWQPDELFIAEVTEDQRLVYRRARHEDFQPARMQPFLATSAPTPRP